MYKKVIFKENQFYQALCSYDIIAQIMRKIHIVNFNARKYAKMKSLKISFSLPVDFESNKFVT